MSYCINVRPLSLAAALVLALSAPAGAQFATVPVAPAPTPYDVRFGPDTAVSLTPLQRDSLKAAARSQLRAWVDSAATGLGIELQLRDSIPVPGDSAALDSLTRNTGAARGAPADRNSVRRDSTSRDSVSEAVRSEAVRRASVRRDSVVGDSIRRDSLSRARRTVPPAVDPSSAAAVQASHTYPDQPQPGRHSSVRYDVVLPSQRHSGHTPLN